MNSLTQEAAVKLQFIANRLPIVMELTVEYHFIPLAEAEEMYPDRKVTAIEKGPLKGMVSVPLPVRIMANHYRRLKKRFIKGGEKPVIDYIREVKALKHDC